MIFTLIQLSRYYPGWQAMEAGYVAAGLNQSKYVLPEEISNLSFFYVIQSPTSQEWMRRWNHTTHLFWKNYLFTRILASDFSKYNISPGLKHQLADNVTFAFSAFWHGFRPVYYLMLPETL